MRRRRSERGLVHGGRRAVDCGRARYPRVNARAWQALRHRRMAGDRRVWRRSNSVVRAWGGPRSGSGAWNRTYSRVAARPSIGPRSVRQVLHHGLSNRRGSSWAPWGLSGARTLIEGRTVARHSSGKRRAHGVRAAESARAATVVGAVHGHGAGRAAQILECPRVMNSVLRYVPSEHVPARHEHQRARRWCRNPDNGPAAPNVRRPERCPAEIGVPHDPEAHPGRCVARTGHPSPAFTRNPNPAPIMEHHATERIVANPYPLVVRAECPVPRVHVGCKSSANHVGIGHPDRAVTRVVDPGAIVVQLWAKAVERVRIGIGIRLLRGIGSGGGR